MYKPKNFIIQELVSPGIHKTWGDKAWMFLDTRLLRSIQKLRSHFGPATINNWHIEGDRKYSGLRPFNCHVGAAMSQHKFGRAADMIFRDHTAEEVRQGIKEFPELFHLITFIEGDVDWLHIDVRHTSRSTDKEKPVIFWSPK
jgi:hypothetical protein